jgi:antitoxin component YwqK of YwqJK toxin-antitoxin module
MNFTLRFILVLLFSFSFYCSYSQEVSSDELFEKDGYLICKIKSGETFSGVMVQKSNDGTVQYKKTIVEGLENGHAEFYDKTGYKLSDGEFKDGIESGKWYWYYKDGQKKAEGFFENGVGVGHWKYWDETGNLVREGEIENNKEQGDWTYYNEKGNITTTRIYHQGLKNGTEIWFYESGQKMLERNYEFGVENGKFSGWFKNGARKFEGNSVNGKIARYIEWDITGKAINIHNPPFEEKNN